MSEYACIWLSVYTTSIVLTRTVDIVLLKVNDEFWCLVFPVVQECSHHQMECGYVCFTLQKGQSLIQVQLRVTLHAFQMSLPGPYGTRQKHPLYTLQCQLKYIYVPINMPTAQDMPYMFSINLLNGRVEYIICMVKYVYALHGCIYATSYINVYCNEQVCYLPSSVIRTDTEDDGALAFIFPKKSSSTTVVS